MKQLKKHISTMLRNYESIKKFIDKHGSPEDKKGFANNLKIFEASMQLAAVTSQAELENLKNKIKR